LPIIGDELREPALIHSNTVFEQRGRPKRRRVGLKALFAKKPRTSGLGRGSSALGLGGKK
jgi:hypothetical protein